MPAGPMPNTMSWLSMASRYRRWLMVFGATRRLPAGRQAALEEVLAQIDRLILRDQIRRRLHVGVRQLVAVAHQRRQLADDAVDVLGPGRLAVHEQLVALRADADVEERFEVLEVLVVGAEQRLDAFLGNGDALDCALSPCYCSYLAAL